MSRLATAFKLDDSIRTKEFELGGFQFKVRVPLDAELENITKRFVSPTEETINARIAKMTALLNAEDVKAAVVEGNTLLKAANNNLQFQVDETTKQVVIKIVDNKTGELVRQIPTVEMLDFIRAMKQQEANIGKLYKNVA